VLDNGLIIFIKYPEAGLVKTRLAKEIGKEKAAFLYRLFVEAILGRTEDRSFRRLVFYTPAKRVKEIVRWLDPKLDFYTFYPQKGKNLGERLSCAFKLSFKNGAKRVVAIGTDIPTIDKNVILDAFKVLENKPCVLGPALDGGYYLIGLSVFRKEIFKEISWGTKYVLRQTINRLHHIKIDYHLLDKCFDIDTYEDLLLLKTNLKGTPGISRYALSHILNALNEIDDIHTIGLHTQRKNGN
jgi:rSAM/selenodomain-associated transferase 1